MTSQTKILLFTRLDTWQPNTLAIEHSVNILYLIINKIIEYTGQSNQNKQLTLYFTDESKDVLKNYEKVWNKIRKMIRSVTNNSVNYDEKYVKIRFNAGGDLSLKKTLQLH